jgi:hypothetical protein
MVVCIPWFEVLSDGGLVDFECLILWDSGIVHHLVMVFLWDYGLLSGVLCSRCGGGFSVSWWGWWRRTQVVLVFIVWPDNRRLIRIWVVSQSVTSPLLPLQLTFQPSTASQGYMYIEHLQQTSQGRWNFPLKIDCQSNSINLWFSSAPVQAALNVNLTVHMRDHTSPEEVNVDISPQNPSAES